MDLNEVHRRINATRLAKSGGYVDLLEGDPREVIVDSSASAKDLRELANALDPREVVAWRVSYNFGETWTVFQHDPSLQLAGVRGVVIRPLVEGETE